MSKPPSEAGGSALERVNVTKTFLPPLGEFVEYLKKIWDSVWLTNQGPLLQEFEQKTSAYLGIDTLQFVANGTIGLQLALRAADVLGGEIITTPFSYVATTSSILWEGCSPVFVDIEPDSLCIDADKIEAAITSKTKAIMAVHVFGLPCNVEEIESLAHQYGLKVIYDGAHAFGARYKGRSLLDYGDISVCSFHATKLFHTVEGGCIITKDRRIARRVELMKHFGHEGDNHQMLGINAKASELQAAMGLSYLPYIEQNIAARKQITGWYDEYLDGERVTQLKHHPDFEPNYAYFPVVFRTEQQLLNVLATLEAKNIFPRRYFYPSLNTLPYLENFQHCPISEDIALRVACLPLYLGLEKRVVADIARVINEASDV